MRKITNNIFKIMITILLSLLVLIGIKSSKSFKQKFYEKVYENHISFSKFNRLYQQYFGNVLPLDGLNTLEPVFNETLIYSEKKPYLDGVELSIENNYLVPSLSDGVVVYIGEKENYGNVIIVNQTSNIDIWYANMETIDVKLYDYVKKGSFLGQASGKIYLVYKQDGQVLDYEKYF